MHYSYAPALHAVFNDYDHHGVLLNLPRLRGEKNAEYKQRLFDVMVHRASSTYHGLIYGITRELGLSLSEPATIEANRDSGGVYLLPNPAVIFKNGLCTLVSNVDPGAYTIFTEIDLENPRTTNYRLAGLAATINATGYFTMTLSADADGYMRSSCLLDQGSVEIMPSEDISFGNGRIELAHQNLVANTVALSSPNLKTRMANQALVNASGKYYVDLALGVIHSYDPPGPGSVIRYAYHSDPKVLIASPVIIHNLQDGHYRKKMFERRVDQLGNNDDGTPSLIGIDIINELYSVVPRYWGA
jgi:hypothetical protein